MTCDYSLARANTVTILFVFGLCLWLACSMWYYDQLANNIKQYDIIIIDEYATFVPYDCFFYLMIILALNIILANISANKMANLEIRNRN